MHSVSQLCYAVCAFLHHTVPGITTMVKIAFDEKLCFADQAAGWKKSEFCSGPVHHRLYLYDM